MSVDTIRDWLDRIESMTPDEIEAAMAAQSNESRFSLLISSPISSSFRTLSKWYSTLNDNQACWVDTPVASFFGVALVILIASVASWLIVYGPPGQYSGAHQWATDQATPTKITYCQNQDFGIKRCGFKTKTGHYGYVESDNNYQWKDIDAKN